MKHLTLTIALLLGSHSFAAIEIVDEPNSISLKHDGEIVWTYNHDPIKGKPYFHPVASTDGTMFTDLPTTDHPWHRGLWFSWKFINGVNYWEEIGYTGVPVGGYTRLLSTEKVISTQQDVVIEQALEYAPSKDASAVMNEQRTIKISTPDEEGTYLIDWFCTFTALDEDIVLDRTPLLHEPNGKSYGGYAGLSVRMNKAVGASGKFVNRSGLVDESSRAKPAAWHRYTVPSGGTMVFMGHPNNLNHPSKWYVAPGMPYFSPAVLFDGAYTIPAGQSLSLSYRIVLSPQEMTQQETEKLWLDWATPKKKVLILSGANNHNWKATTEVLKASLESSESIEVDVELQPETLTAETLAQYDALLSNWNAFGKGRKPTPWPESFREAYVDFVRSGGGHIVVHAGSSSNYDWQDYQAICLATWKGKTGHGKQHTFELRLTETDHPVTEGLSAMETTDELWFRPMVHPSATVLAEAFSKTTGNWEPSVFIGQFGEGRCFTMLLGHGPEHMEQPLFQEFLLRGTNWVTGK